MADRKSKSLTFHVSTDGGQGLVAEGRSSRPLTSLKLHLGVYCTLTYMSLNKKKNKRGGRGSIDEDLACWKKKLNTADDAIELLEDQQQEPSLMEIKTILIDIQIQLSSITKDNLELKKRTAKKFGEKSR